MSDEAEDNGLIVTKKHLRVGMYLVDVSLGMPYCPPTGLIVTGISDDGFYARDDRHHNVWGYTWDELKHFRLYTDEPYSELPEKYKKDIEWSVGNVNWCLYHDRDGRDA